MKEKRIVKIQVALFDLSEKKRNLLVYDEKHEWNFQGLVPMKDIKYLLKGEVKGFWWAINRKGKIEMLSPAPWQTW